MELTTIIAITSALGTAGILIQNYFSSKKLDKIQSHFQAEKEPPEWSVEDLKAKEEGRNPPFLKPEIENAGEGTAKNVEIYGHPVSHSNKKAIGSKRREDIETVYPGNKASVKVPVRSNADAIHVKIRSDGQDDWDKELQVGDYELEDWFYEKMDDM